MCSLLNLKNFQPVPNAEKLFVLQVMQKADSNSSAGAEVDSEQKAEVTTSSSNDTKHHVVGSQMSVTTQNVLSVCDELSPILNQINDFLTKHNLTKKDISFFWRGDKIAPFISCG